MALCRLVAGAQPAAKELATEMIAPRVALGVIKTTKHAGEYDRGSAQICERVSVANATGEAVDVTDALFRITN